MTLGELAEKHEFSRMKISKEDIEELGFKKIGVYYVSDKHLLQIHKEDFRKMTKEYILHYIDTLQEIRQNEN